MSLEAPARVIALDGEVAVVELLERQTGCGRCHEPGGCGGTLLSQMRAPDKGEYRVLNSIGATLNAEVVLAIPDGSLLRASLMAYCLPLAGVMLGAGIGTWCFASDDAVIAASVFGLLIGVLGLKWMERQRREEGLVRLQRKRADSVCQHSGDTRI